jgi:hypothetical protein
MRLLDRLGRQTDPAEADKLAVELRGVLGPECLERPQGLVGVAAARVERRAEDLDLFLPLADADVAEEPAVRRRVDAGEHLGH